MLVVFVFIFQSIFYIEMLIITRMQGKAARVARGLGLKPGHLSNFRQKSWRQVIKRLDTVLVEWSQ